MKRLALIIGIIWLSACSKEVSSITGEIDAIEKDSLGIECTNLFKKSKDGTVEDDIGYSCTIKIIEDTLIKSQTGEKLTLNDLHQNDVVSVILTQKLLKEDLSSGTLIAKEVILIEN